LESSRPRSIAQRLTVRRDHAFRVETLKVLPLED
jgi:hypothetical protein